MCAIGKVLTIAYFIASASHVSLNLNYTICPVRTRMPGVEGGDHPATGRPYLDIYRSF
jgi:hypothetical protein